MKALFTSAALLLLAPFVWAAPPVLTPAELLPLLKRPEIRVIDIRDLQSFELGHIEGAVNAPYRKWIGPASNPGMVPEQAELTQLVQSIGITPETYAVVVSNGVDANDFGAMTRVYWTLKSLGLKELSVLNGGMMAWENEGEITDQGPNEVAPSQFKPSFNPQWLSTQSDVKQNLRLNNATLLDSRPDAFYLGKQRIPAAKVSGTLPGAKQLDFNQWFTPGTSQFVSRDKVSQIAAQVQREPGKDVIAFCNTGHLSAIDWFALSEVLGQPGVRMYAGSMVDWTQSKEPPQMANQPNRAESLAYDARQWWNRKFK